MLAKLNSKNQLTLPKAILEKFGPVEFFDVTSEDGRIVLVPVPVTRADAVRDKLRERGFTEADVGDAVNWARKSR